MRYSSEGVYEFTLGSRNIELSTKEVKDIFDELLELKAKSPISFGDDFEDAVWTFSDNFFEDLELIRWIAD